MLPFLQRKKKSLPPTGGRDRHDASIGRKPLVVGIDIGSYSVKVCQLKVRRGQYEVIALGSGILPPGAVEEGVLLEPEAVADVVAAIFTNLKIKEKRVAVAVSGHSVIVKKINLAAMDDKALEEFIRAEADQYIPFDIDEVYLDFQNLHSDTADSGRSDVILAAARRELVDAYRTMLEAIDLSPRVIDVDAFALQNICEFTEALPENAALIDIGASKISINFLFKGASSMARDIQYGSNHLTERISSRLRLSGGEAEAVKRGSQRIDEHLEALHEIYHELMEQWTGEIRRAFDLYAKAQPGAHLQKIYITGGGSRMKGIAGHISRVTNVPVAPLHAFSSFIASPKVIDPRYLQFMEPEMAVAAGLAMRTSML